MGHSVGLQLKKWNHHEIAKIRKHQPSALSGLSLLLLASVAASSCFVFDRLLGSQALRPKGHLCELKSYYFFACLNKETIKKLKVTLCISCGLSADMVLPDKCMNIFPHIYTL